MGGKSSLRGDSNTEILFKFYIGFGNHGAEEEKTLSLRATTMQAQNSKFNNLRIDSARLQTKTEATKQSVTAPTAKQQ